MSGRFESIVTIDDRFLVLALDRLYRDAMQAFERTTLLAAARKIAEALDLGPLDVPPEGYYQSDPALTEFFRLMRALQNVSDSRMDAVTGLPEFLQLSAVTNSPIYGRPVKKRTLFPRSIDALAHALLTARPEWTVAKLVRAAHAAALEIDDYSLVGLAARIEDAVIITAVRESLVLYVEYTTLGLSAPPTFVWNVHPDLAAQANRFVQAFNMLVPHALPAVTRENAPLFYDPDSSPDHVIGRCVRIGEDPQASSTGTTIGQSVGRKTASCEYRTSGATRCGRPIVICGSARARGAASIVESVSLVNSCNTRSSTAT